MPKGVVKNKGDPDGKQLREASSLMAQAKSRAARSFNRIRG